MLASVGVAARDPFQYGDILTRPFGTRIFNLTVVLQGHTVGNSPLIIRKEARRFLWVVPSPVIQLCG